MDKTYKPQDSEDKTYKMWEEAGYFTPKPSPKRQPFCIIMPPPNANGVLHVGHAVFVTLEDIMIRYHRMKGEAALWVPGADHAGIATQVVYEKKLAKEGKTRFDLGREEFVKQIYDFSIKNKETMENQLRKLGASCDWTRGKFTLDPKISESVLFTFKKLYDDGLIYRGERIINWCPRCQTALSDLEVQHKEKPAKLYYIKYPIVGSDEFITVATTRPETMLGDTAVAVNPEDKRFKPLLEKKVKIKLPLTNREAPLIADERVEAEFGTGAVKVTPGHDPLDFEISQKHKLPAINVINKESKMTREAGKDYEGLGVREAREGVLQGLKKLGLLEKEEDYKSPISICERCKATIEPLISKQWFVKAKELAKPAIKAVKNKEIEFVPKRFEKLYYHWMENIRDWCISRQIWWGHRIPVWYCGKANNISGHKMGFHKDVVPQVSKGKTKTYRLRNHHFKVGDKVVFENSQTKTLFGYGIITSIEEMKVEEIDYKDKTHYKVYKNQKELIAAFRLRNPDKNVTPKSEAYLYEYEFHPFTKQDAKKGCGQIIVSLTEPKQCPACKGTNLHQDPDTLDSWFSSGQWPFNVFGWPKKTADFKYFYPTTVMETGWDILFFWVARMIMLGIYCTGQIPFSYVYMHGLVRDKDRQKMSKSKGNVIDPLGVIDLHGADALRMALVFGTGPGNDVIISEEKIIAHRKFANKIWNASRFVLGQTENTKLKKGEPDPITKADSVILGDMESTIKLITQYMENFQFHQAATHLHSFFWHWFCDKYIEESKKQMVEGQPKEQIENTKEILLHVLLTSLKLLHPFMPFVTEQIYQLLPSKPNKALIIESWPNA